MFYKKLILNTVFLIIIFTTCLYATDDPYYNNQWNLSSINVAEAWDITTGSSDIVIAVIGIGVDLDHEDLEGNIETGYNIITESEDTNPINSGLYHETAVAGIIGAIANNNKGMAGIAYNCKIMPIVFRRYMSSGIDFDSLAIAINWAVDLKV